MAVFFINETGVIGQIMEAGTQNLTGSMTATLLFILLFLMVVALSFGIPLEFLAVIILPFCLSVGAYYGTFMVPIIVMLIYISSIIAKNWLFK